MLKKRYRLYHLPLLAFYSRKLYKDVGRKWTGINFAYLFLLLAACWIIPVLNLRENLVSTLGSNQFHVINQIPDLYIANGQVMLDQTEPLYITQENGTPVAIIDTSGSANFIYQDGINILLTANTLVVRSGKDSFTTISLSPIKELHLNSEIIIRWLLITNHAMTPLSYGIFLMLSFVCAVLALLLAAIIGLILTLAMHQSLRFSAIIRIAAVAITPAIILITLSVAFGFAIPDLVYPASTLIYLYLGIKACKQSEKEKEARINLAALIS